MLVIQTKIRVWASPGTRDACPRSQPFYLNVHSWTIFISKPIDIYLLLVPRTSLVHACENNWKNSIFRVLCPKNLLISANWFRNKLLIASHGFCECSVNIWNIVIGRICFFAKFILTGGGRPKFRFKTERAHLYQSEDYELLMHSITDVFRFANFQNDALVLNIANNFKEIVEIEASS